MPDQDSSQDPPRNPDKQSSPLAPPPPSVEQGVMGDYRNGDTKQSKAETQELVREIHWVEKATMWSQIGLAIVGIAALVVYHGQLTVMQRQLDEMGRATKAASASAAAAKDTLELTNNSIRLDKRAWVGIAPPLRLDYFTVDPSNKNYSLRFFVMIKNYGPSVALNVVSSFSAANFRTIAGITDESCLSAIKHLTAPDPDRQHAGYVLFPNDTVSAPGAELGNMEQLSSNIGSLYIAGCIVYEDQFQITHRTRVCMQTFPDIIRGAISRKAQPLYACASDAN